jgi:hypothetical protein
VFNTPFEIPKKLIIPPATFPSQRGWLAWCDSPRTGCGLCSYIGPREAAMSRKPLFFLAVLVIVVTVSSLAFARELIPAGTILQCTVSEPNFSSKTAQVGDPVLCHLGALGAFGHSVFPRGAELGGHLEDAKSPGHFVGKGWLKLEFDRMILPGAEVMPLSAKIISSPHMGVDAEGRIHGKGHRTRDVVEWMIPILWPIKVLTLPNRGPFPALKGETRLSLRLMEDVEVPSPVARANVPMPPWARPSGYQPADYRVFRPSSATLEDTTVDAPAEPRAADPVVVAAQPAVQPAIQADPDAALTILALVGGEAYLARDYRVQDGEVHCLPAEGEQKIIPLERVDLYQTSSLNRQRHVKFVLQARNTAIQSR